MPQTANHLIDEKSPYLLQHAYNPVEWYPWGDAAFQKAREEDKPLFLSIGYSTCHWCHVMEHESFSDPEVAELINDAFVAVKVDREERPDIDQIYMTTCQMVTGGGGWPLTIFLTPDRKPFFTGTYIPKTSRFGRVGLMELLPRVKSLWDTRREELLRSAEQITRALKSNPGAAPGNDLGEETLIAGYEQFDRQYDQVWGGFGEAPKFPSPHSYMFLLRYGVRNGNSHALEMVSRSLDRMRVSGLFDHVGGGFHRYATDRQWRVPHFEKMLYDQALLILVYTEAFLATGNPLFRETASKTVAYVCRDLLAPEDAFYAAEDADSEGEEGKFYLWTWSELETVLDESERHWLQTVYHITPEGNFQEESTGQRTGANIVYRTHTDVDQAIEKQVFNKLFRHREKRPRPARDEKILTDWNGLMIAALSYYGKSVGDEEAISRARRVTTFILEHMRPGPGRLLHRYREGDAAIDATVNDYVYLVWGLLELYEASYETDHLKQARELMDELVARFWDPAGGFFYTASEATDVLVRQKDYMDGAIPSANSVAMMNLLRLARYLGDVVYEQRAAHVQRSAAKSVQKHPTAFAHLLSATAFALGPVYEVVITGMADQTDTRNMIDALNRSYLPNTVRLFKPADQQHPDIEDLADFTRDQIPIQGSSTAYICRHHYCLQPTTDIDEMLEILTSGSAAGD